MAFLHFSATFPPQPRQRLPSRGVSVHSDGQALYHPRTGRAQPGWNRSVVSSYGNAAGPGEVPQEAHHQYDLSAFRSMTTGRAGRDGTRACTR